MLFIQRPPERDQSTMISFKCKLWRLLMAVVLIGIATSASAIDLLKLPAIKTGVASKDLLLDVAVRGDNSFAAVGQYGVIILSSDDGVSWTQADVPVSVMLTGVNFPTPKLGWAVGHDGLILHTTDGGLSWQKQLDGYALNKQIIAIAELSVQQVEDKLKQLQSAEPADPNAIDDAQYNLEEAQFMLEGAREDVAAGPVRPLLDVWFRNAREGFVVGSYGMLLHTTDAGETWKLVSNRMDNPEGFHLNHITPAPDGNLYIAGEAGFVYRSADGGETWDSLEPGYPGSFYGLVVVPAAAGGYELLVYGLRGNLFSSTDKGETWTRVDSGTPVTLLTGMLLGDGTVVIAGQAGTILARPAGQQSFTPVKNPDRRVIAALTQLENGNLLLVGAGGVHEVSSKAVPVEVNSEKP